MTELAGSPSQEPLFEPPGVGAGEPAHAYSIETPAALDALARGWDSLTGDRGLPTRTHAWTRAGAKALARAGDLRIVVVGSVREPSAVAPLVRRIGGIPRLAVLGAEELGEPTDFPAASDDALIRLVWAIREMRLPLVLHRVPAGSRVVEALRHAHAGHGVVVVRPVAGCAWIPLHPGWRAPESQLDARHRSDLRRAIRSATALGAVTVETLSPTPRELPALMDEVIRLDAASGKRRWRTALARDPRREEFFRVYAAAACVRDRLRVCRLSIGGEPAAVQLAVQWGHRLWRLKVVCDRRFARCSPGLLLTLETIRAAAEEDLHAYEFLGSDETCTRVWTSETRECVSVRAYPPSPLGMAALAADAGRLAWARLRRALSEAAR